MRKRIRPWLILLPLDLVLPASARAEDLRDAAGRITGLAGTAVRRSLTLVVHDSTQPKAIPSDWKPAGRCLQQPSAP